MKMFIAAATLSLISAASHVNAADLLCTSSSYQILVSDLSGDVWANYAVNGEVNDGADVRLDQKYISDKIISASLNVDGQPGIFELSVTKNKKGIFTGKIFRNKTYQTAVCADRGIFGRN